MNVTFGPKWAALDLRDTPEASGGAQAATNARRDRGRLEGYEGDTSATVSSSPIRKEMYHRTDAGGANHYVVAGTGILLETATGYVDVYMPDGVTPAVKPGTDHITGTQMGKQTIFV